MRKINKIKILFAAFATMLLSCMPVMAAEVEEQASSVLAEVESRFEIIIPKQLEMIVDDSYHGTADYKAGVIGDIEVSTSVYVVPQSTFFMANTDDTSIEDVLVSVEQDKVEWTWMDLMEEETIWGNGTLDGSNFGLGHSEGIFYFNIEKDEAGKNVTTPIDSVNIFTVNSDQTEYTQSVIIAESTSSKIVVQDEAGKDITKEMEWTSDNDKIKVEDGVIDVTEAEPGDSAVVTGTDGETTITVPVDIYGLLLNTSAETVHVGDQVEVDATILGVAPSDTVSWSDPEQYSAMTVFNLMQAEAPAINLLADTGSDFEVDGNVMLINTDNMLGMQIVSARVGSVRKYALFNVIPGVAPTISSVTDGEEYQQTVTFTVGEEDTVTVNGNPVTLTGNQSYTINQNTDETGTYEIKVTGSDGSTITVTIKVVHVHAYSNWVTGTAATCTAAGTQTRTCSKCSKVESQNVAALGHNWVNGADKVYNATTANGTYCWPYDSADSYLRNIPSGTILLGAHPKNEPYTSALSANVSFTFTDLPSATTLTISHHKCSYTKFNKNDKISYFIDGVQTVVKTFSKTEYDMTNLTIPVPAGTHTIKVQFDKSSSGSDSHYIIDGSVSVSCPSQNCSRCGATK